MLHTQYHTKTRLHLPKYDPLDADELLPRLQLLLHQGVDFIVCQETPITNVQILHSTLGGVQLPIAIDVVQLGNAGELARGA